MHLSYQKGRSAFTEFETQVGATAVDLLDEDTDNFDEIEDDASYEQDAAIVSELLRQLAAQSADASSPEPTPTSTPEELRGSCPPPTVNPPIAWMVSGIMGVAAIALLVAVCFYWKPASGTFSIPAESVWHQIKDSYFLKHQGDRR